MSPKTVGTAIHTKPKKNPGYLHEKHKELNKMLKEEQRGPETVEEAIDVWANEKNTKDASGFMKGHNALNKNPEVQHLNTNTGKFNDIMGSPDTQNTIRNTKSLPKNSEQSYSATTSIGAVISIAAAGLFALNALKAIGKFLSPRVNNRDDNQSMGR